jgi:hypothetical protein
MTARFIRFNVAVQPEGHDEPIHFMVRWNDFRLWERATGQSFAELESAMASVLSDAAYFTAKRKKLFLGTIDEFFSGDFGFEEGSAAMTDPIQPDHSIDNSSSSLSPQESVSESGPPSVSVP